MFQDFSDLYQILCFIHIINYYLKQKTLMPSYKSQEFNIFLESQSQFYTSPDFVELPSLNLAQFLETDKSNDEILHQEIDQSHNQHENMKFQEMENHDPEDTSRDLQDSNKKQQPRTETNVSFPEETKPKKKTQQLAKNRNPTFMQTILVHLFASVLLKKKEKLQTKSLYQIKKRLKSKYRAIHKILMSNSTSEAAFKKLLNSKLSKDQKQNEKLWSEILNENRIYQIIEELDITPENQAVREYYFWFTPILKEIRKKENASVKILQLEKRKKRYQQQLNSKRRKEFDEWASLRYLLSTAPSDSPQLLTQQIEEVSELGLEMTSMHEMGDEFFDFPHETPKIQQLNVFQQAQALTANNQNSTTTRSQSQNFGINNTSPSQIGNDCDTFIDSESYENFYRLNQSDQALVYQIMQLK